MGFNMLIYFCATGYKNIDVINGHERGTRLDYIKNIDTQQIRKSHAFLDNSTGDFYSLSQVISRPRTRINGKLQGIAVCII